MSPDEKRLLERIAKGIEDIGRSLRELGDGSERASQQLRVFGEVEPRSAWPIYDN